MQICLLDRESRTVIEDVEKSIGPMQVISRKRLNEFAGQHPETGSSLAHWFGLMKRSDFSNITELRETFPSADRVGKLTVFNLGGNKVRPIAAIHYNRQKIYVRSVLTHAECDEQRWKE